MGEVYRATDTNLKRAVAIKVLPASVAADAERLARFQREAEVLASLNHPNIAAIYGLERSGATHRPRDGTRRGRGSLAAHRARRDPARRSAADREADRGGARSGARAGDHSSRSQAREHQGPRRRHGEGARLRVGEGDGARGCDVGERVAVADDHDAGDDAGRDDPGHGRVHVAGAGEGQDRRQARRHLGVRLRAVRDAVRAATVHGRRRFQKRWQT